MTLSHAVARARILAGVAATAGALTLTAACGSSGSTTGSGGSGGSSGSVVIPVVAGENFWGNIAEQIGGPRVKVTSIISDPDTDPHEYETDPTDAAAVSGAKLVIENGAGYDDFLVKQVAAAGGGKQVLNVAELVGVSGDDANPHLWYSPTYVTRAAQAIQQQLAAADPADASTFAANLAAFLKAYQPYIDTISRIKAKYDGQAVSYTERVPGYLLDAAGLHLGTPVAFSQAVEDDADPTPADTAQFNADLKDHKVKALLYNSQVTDEQTTAIKKTAQSAGVPIVGVSETIPPGQPDFQSWQIAQAEALLAALGGCDIVPAIHLRRAGLRFGDRTLWQGLDLRVDAGEFVAVLGPNGSGKTSLLKVLLGLQPLTQGTVEVNGRPPRRGSRLVGYVPQQRAFDRDLPARGRDLVALGLDGHRWGMGLPTRARRARVDAALAQVGAQAYADRPVGRLSGGEQQRLRLAQALLGDPTVLLCDEPLLSLDLQHQQAVTALIDQRRRERDTAVVFVTHEVNPVLPLVDRIVYLVDGRWAAGAPEEVMTTERLSQLYRIHVDVVRVHGRIVVVGAPDAAHADAGGSHHHEEEPSRVMWS